MKQKLSPLAANKYTAQKLQSMDPDLIMNPFTNLISVSLDQENHRSQAPSPAAKNQKLHQQYFKGADQHGHSFKVVLQKSTNGLTNAQEAGVKFQRSPKGKAGLTMYISHRNQTQLDKL